MVSGEDGRCPIWGVNCNIRHPFDGSRIAIVENSLRTGGDYEITREAELAVQELSNEEKARVTSVMVEQWMKGVDIPRLMANDVQSAKARQSLPVHERAERFLSFLVKSSSNEIGQFLHIGERQPQLFYPALAWSESIRVQELLFLSDYLRDQGYITKQSFSGYEFGAKVEVPGYRRIEELKTVTDSSQCFVAMWFDQSTDEAYEQGIKPAVETAGYSPLRIDRREFIGKIDDEIVAQIRRSGFLVADFTQGDDGVRGGVYYEAGFAHGLGLPVIFTCHRGSIGKLHFDTRQFNHIVWESPSELQRQLIHRIGSVLGDGPIRTG